MPWQGEPLTVAVPATVRQRGSEAAAMRCCGDNGAGLMLFGVKLHAAPAAASSAVQLQKSYSLDCMQVQQAGRSSPTAYALFSSSSLLVPIDEGGYLSDNGARSGTAMRERKKGVPWSKEEHRLFLAGLEKLGRGDWRGISRGFVTTRTPTQVASHAQKFFLRQSSAGKTTNGKRRSSLFDMSCKSGRSGDPDSSACKAPTSTSLPSLKASYREPWKETTTAIDRVRPLSEASVAESTAAMTSEQARGYYHLSPLNLELGMSLSAPSIGT